LSVTNKNNKYTALIGIGSNIDPEKNIRLAVRRLSREVDILSCSRVWQNPAVGSTGPDYLNAALLVESEMGCHELKHDILLPLESNLNRVRTSNKNADRTIDLDILLFDENCLDEEMWTQPHVSIPCAEIMPHLKNPKTKETLQSAAERLFPGEGFFLREDIDLCSLYKGL